MKRCLLLIAGLVILAPIAGLLVAVSGIVPIKASSGHWPITAWFLNFSSSRSVATHSAGIPVPPLDDPALVLRGAVRYDMGCAPCHGRPGFEHPPIPLAMTPSPPYLGDTVREWEPEELFYLTKHGIKFTGMPAWPTQQRDDEVWAMVAFLVLLPEMSQSKYRELTFAQLGKVDDAATTEDLAEPTGPAVEALETCRRCHGTDGMGRGVGAFPHLAGQTSEYLANALVAFGDGERPSGIMGPLAAGLDREAMQALAKHYAQQSPTGATDTEEDTQDTDLIALGRQIAVDGIPSQKLPACAECHGPSKAAINPAYPRLANQHANYLVRQLELFKAGHRGGSKYAHLMDPTAEHIEPEQMRAVAAYYASLESAKNDSGE